MRRGITILEMLVAAVLLSVGLLGTLGVVAQSTRTAIRLRDRSQGLIVARSKLEEVLKEPILQTGQDRGQGVDDTTDYDWEVTIEPTQSASLVSISVIARNRISGVEVAISALRRPDIETLPETAGATAAGSGTGAAAGTAPAGSPL